MFESSTYRQVLLAVLVALSTLSGAVAGMPKQESTEEPIVTEMTAPAGTNATDPANATATIFYDGARLTVPNASAVGIRGETTLEPGTEVLVVVKSKTTDFIEPERAFVQDNGTFNTTFDLEDMEPGEPFNVTVRTRDTVISVESIAQILDQSDIHGTLRMDYPTNEDGNPVLETAANQTIHIETDAAPDTEVKIRVEAPPASSLETYEISLDENGTGTATLDLSDVDSGTKVNVSLRHKDAGTLAEKTVIALDESAMSDEQTTEPTTYDESGALSTTTSDKSETAPTATTTEPSGESTVPGFGVPVALVALLSGTALLVRRR